MKNQWTNFFTGSLQVRIEGQGIERVINECVRNHILIWQVKKHGSQSVTFHMMLKDIKKIRTLMRNSGCKLYFVERRGMPFLVRKTLLNSGFLIGFVLFLFIITVLSNMVWDIEIEGANPQTEHQISRELKKIGISKGKFQFLLDDANTIQRQLTDKIDAITWIGVELKGTTYQFQVVEKNVPEPPEYISPRHIVAKKKAIITDLFVEEGQPLVTVNDHVEKGDIIVSGIIGKEGQTEIVSARGEIFGETWYKSDVTVPLSTSFNVFTGNYKQKHYVKIGNWTTPIWGFKQPEFENYEVDNDVREIRFLKWSLPISYVKVTVREKEKVTRQYTINEAIEAAKKIGRNDLLTKLDDDAKIKGEKVLRKTEQNGKVKVSIHYQVIENIVATEPIIQGD